MTASRERGFSLAELSIAMGIVGLLLAVSGMGGVAAIRTADLESSIQTAIKICNAADAYRRRPASTTIATTGTTHTWNDLGVDVPVSALNAAIGAAFPVQTPYGTPYLVTARGTTPASVSFVVPEAGLDPPGVTAVPVGTGTRIIVHPTPRPTNTSATGALHRWVKNFFYLEESR